MIAVAVPSSSVNVSTAPAKTGGPLKTLPIPRAFQVVSGWPVMEKPCAVKKSGVFQLLAESLYSSVSRAVPPPPKAMPGFELPPPRLPSMEKNAVL